MILTGIRANNDLTIGNYFGAILPIIDMAKNKSDEYQINLFVPDLHSFTTPIDHSKLQEQIMHNLRLFVAAGLPLDNENVHIYRQSYIPAHSELTWILDCFTGMGELSRMTQFKEKSRQNKEQFLENSELYKVLKSTEEKNTNIKRPLSKILEEHTVLANVLNDIRKAGQTAAAELLEQEINHLNNENKKNLNKMIEMYNKLDDATVGTFGEVGLFNYPVLMASDILLYNATYVPVGDDQTQHLEFTRDIAERMNNKFNQELFTIPEPVKKQHEFFGKDQGLRIKDLQDPTKKMSKSDDSGKGVIFLGDSPDVAAKKIMSAATDSIGVINLDWENQPGISNLLQILALFDGHPVEEVELIWKGSSNYGDFKKAVASVVKDFLTWFQDRLAQVDDEAIKSKLESSEKAMNETANETLLKVQKAVGLR